MYRIAVLDDDEHWCLIIKSFLSNDFEVSTFNYADSLLEEIVQEIERYDLIMVDLSLPPSNYKYVDGRQLIRYLKENLPQPPLLVLVTAFISNKILEAGQGVCPEADAFLAKDIGIDQMSQQLKLLLKTRGKGTENVSNCQFSQ